MGVLASQGLRGGAPGDQQGVNAVGAFRLVVGPVALVSMLATLTTGSAAIATTADDTTPPEFTFKLTSLSINDWTEHASWGSKDNEGGVGVSYSTARWRTKVIGGTWGRWHHPLRWHTLPADASISKHFKPGHEYQIQARVFDKAGNHTIWTSAGGGVRPST